ncbi:MAG TPA: hypothetical protein VJ723_11305, partial [Candidatus Angelobacter sp.]|nr:hypothetical protein [Candidatus Angelobacter sp.]
ILYKLASRWEREAREDSRNYYPYITLLDDLLFHAEFRFPDYIAFEQDGPFFHRLQNWLENLEEDAQQQVLLQSLDHLIFFDSSQMRALHRDAFRRILVPWISRKIMTTRDYLAEDIDERLYALLSQCALFSITESFHSPEFLKVNGLLGLSKPSVLTEDEGFAEQIISSTEAERIVIFEDFVGTGNQAFRILNVVQKAARNRHIIFIPLIILETGLTNLQGLRSKSFAIEPVITIPSSGCLTSEQHIGEPKEFSFIRALVWQTAERVMQKQGQHDDAPEHPFGYENSGGLVVTCHNSPNNTLPLVHHKAPLWDPLFRRLHHKTTKKGLPHGNKPPSKRKN